MIKSLSDDLSKGSIQIDAIQMKGPDFSSIDSKKLNLLSMALEYSSATIFSPNNEVIQPKDYIYKKKLALLIIEPQQELPAPNFVGELLSKICANENCSVQDLNLVVNIVFRQNTLINTPSYDVGDFYDRCQLALGRGYVVLASRFSLGKELIHYFESCKPESLIIFIDYQTLIQKLNRLYRTSPHIFIGYIANLFSQKTKIYAYDSTKKVNVPRLNPLCVPLFSYLRDLGLIVLT